MKQTSWEDGFYSQLESKYIFRLSIVHRQKSFEVFFLSRSLLQSSKTPVTGSIQGIKHSLVCRKFDWSQRNAFKRKLVWVRRREKKFKLPHTDSPHVLIFNHNNTNQSVPNDICDYQHRKHQNDHSLGWIGQHDGFYFLFSAAIFPKTSVSTGVKFMLLNVQVGPYRGFTNSIHLWQHRVSRKVGNNWFTSHALQQAVNLAIVRVKPFHNERHGKL